MQIPLTYVGASYLVVMRIVFSEDIVHACDIHFGMVVSLIEHFNMKVIVVYSIGYIPVYLPPTLSPEPLKT